jgi:hypothetical protein
MVAMAELHTAHTAELDAATLTATRALLYDVVDNMTGHDWEHALGWEGADLIGHASVIQRRLLHRGRPPHPRVVTDTPARLWPVASSRATGLQ